MNGEKAGWAGRLAVALLLFATYPSHAQMYKCVDERGVTHYSDKPRPGCKGGKVDIQPIPPVSGKVAAPRSTNVPQQDADFKRRQMEREHAEAKDKAALEQRCARLRQEHATLASGVRLGKISAQGERAYLDDATRDARLVKLREELRGCP
jgi:hypothetical protein